MRVVLVHDWLTGMRGGERVLEALLPLFPDAEIYTLVHVPGSCSHAIEAREIHTSFLQGFPGVRRGYRHLLPLFPLAATRLDPGPVDLIVSDSHAVAKGVTAEGALHLCYCHTPMRYVWDQYDEYFGPGRAPFWTRVGAAVVAPALRRWDVRTAQRVDAFIANSLWVRDRIRRCYGRSAAVVHPPVDLHRFAPGPSRDDFYLVVSALVPYKRVDLAIEACARLGRRLVVVGDGPERERLMESGRDGVIFRGRVDDAEVSRLMSRCRGLLHPAVEDFGIVMVEARAAGAPVIACAEGGGREIVEDLRDDPSGGTGLRVAGRTVEAWVEAILTLEALDPPADQVARGVERFSVPRFQEEMAGAVETLTGWRPVPPPPPGHRAEVRS